MHSRSSGRYQSRLFNFVHQQTRRLGERFESAVKNLQVATSWSLQALVYPVYLLLQKTMESAGKQLHATEQQQRLETQEVKDQTSILPEIDRLLTKLTGDSDKTSGQSQQTNVEEGIEYQPSLNPNLPVVLLDAAVASVESKIVPVYRATEAVQQKSSFLLQVVQTKLNIFLDGKAQLISEKGGVENSENQGFQIQALIWAAVNFFFGDACGKDFVLRRTNKKLQHTPANTVLPINPSRTSGKKLPHYPTTPLLNSHQWENLADPWLTSADLFGDGEVSELGSQNVTSHTNPALPKASTAEYSPYNWRNWINNYLKFFRQPKPGSGLVQQKKSSSDLIPTAKTSAKIVIIQQIESFISRIRSDAALRPATKWHRNTGEITQQQSPHTQVEAKPDYIETKAKTIGYEKHPLEQILEWLDRAMLWIEETFVKVFHRLQRLWLEK